MVGLTLGGRNIIVVVDQVRRRWSTETSYLDQNRGVGVSVMAPVGCAGLAVMPLRGGQKRVLADLGD